jgi:hypothetical protein
LRINRLYFIKLAISDHHSSLPQKSKQLAIFIAITYSSNFDLKIKITAYQYFRQLPHLILQDISQVNIKIFYFGLSIKVELPHFFVNVYFYSEVSGGASLNVPKLLVQFHQRFLKVQP